MPGGWAAEGGEEAMKQRLEDPAIRQRLTPEIAELVEMVAATAVWAMMWVKAAVRTKHPR